MPSGKYIAKGLHDINTIFAPKSSGSAAAATSFKINGTDLNQYYECLGENSAATWNTSTNFIAKNGKDLNQIFALNLINTSTTTCAYHTFAIDGGIMIVITGNGNLKLRYPTTKMDLYVLGGGGGGGAGGHYGEEEAGGGGGSGGYATMTVTNTNTTNYISWMTVTIGAGGSAGGNGGTTRCVANNATDLKLLEVDSYGGGRGGTATDGNESICKGGDGGSGGGGSSNHESGWAGGIYKASEYTPYKSTTISNFSYSMSNGGQGQGNGDGDGAGGGGGGIAAQGSTPLAYSRSGGNGGQGEYIPVVYNGFVNNSFGVGGGGGGGAGVDGQNYQYGGLSGAEGSASVPTPGSTAGGNGGDDIGADGGQAGEDSLQYGGGGGGASNMNGNAVGVNGYYGGKGYQGLVVVTILNANIQYS